jgi:hypothetical protein
MCCAVSGAARPNMRRAPDDWPELKKIRRAMKRTGFFH